jgi:hypothetical protein
VRTAQDGKTPFGVAKKSYRVDFQNGEWCKVVELLEAATKVGV